MLGNGALASQPVFLRYGMNFGKNIRLYLVDGVPNGLTIAEIMNWTGHVMQSPRSGLADLLRREEMSRTGIYILTGEDPEAPGQMLVYVGESDSVKQRLIQHNRSESNGGKDFWDKATVVTSKDANLTKGHVRYLESRLVEIITAARRASLHNQTAPNQVTLPESDVADMESFLEQMKIILSVLGIDIFRKAAVGESNSVSSDTFASQRRSPIFELKPKKNPLRALAQEIDSEFIVKAGSQARLEWTGVRHGYMDLRQSLIDQRKLMPDDGGHFMIFQQDTPFKSPSAASAVILGRSDNGRKTWIVQGQGQSYDFWQASLVGEFGSTDEA
jgi:hypothetical protein